jgi:hypothetical protein
MAGAEAKNQDSPRALLPLSPHGALWYLFGHDFVGDCA